MKQLDEEVLETRKNDNFESEEEFKKSFDEFISKCKPVNGFWEYSEPTPQLDTVKMLRES